MTLETSDRGFQILKHEEYCDPKITSRLVQQSSAIGEYVDSSEKPGSSFLWIGDKHHLDRGDVEELVEYLNCWLRTGTLDGTGKSLERGK